MAIKNWFRFYFEYPNFTLWSLVGLGAWISFCMDSPMSFCIWSFIYLAWGVAFIRNAAKKGDVEFEEEYD